MHDLARLFLARFIDCDPCIPASVRSVRAATSGLKGSTASVVMMLSRPKRVANQGIPAMMKVPSVVCEMSEVRSACERVNSESNRVLLAESLAHPQRDSSISTRRAASALSKSAAGVKLRPLRSRSQPPVMRISSPAVSPRARLTRNAARSPLSACGIVSNMTSVKRLTPSSPS
jgi:hypothetical protein